MFDFNGKKVLVAGGTGLIGIPLVRMLIENGTRVRIASLDDKSRAHKEAEFIKADLKNFGNCLSVCSGMDYVFNLVCLKGSPDAVRKFPYDFLMSNSVGLNLLDAAFKTGVGGFLVTSSVGVYSSAKVFLEDDVWNTLPSRNDWYAGNAKRFLEIQANALQEQHGDKIKISIVRPTNTYGPWDNFSPINSMVVPSLIRRVFSGENPLVVRAKNTKRDFLFSEDAALGMIHVAEAEVIKPINLGTGIGRPIGELGEIILRNIENPPELLFEESSKVKGDSIRIMDISFAKSINWEAKCSLEEGVEKTVKWYRDYKDRLGSFEQYNALKK